MKTVERVIDQIRASKLPSNMMQFAARGALQVPPAENLEILVHLAKHNRVFGELARMTLAGWDEKASLAAAADPQTSADVLNYLISPDNLRPVLLPTLLENPSVQEAQLAKMATSAMRDTISIMLKSQRVRSMRTVVSALKGNPYLSKEDAEELRKMSPLPAESVRAESLSVASPNPAHAGASADEPVESPETGLASPEAESSDATVGADDDHVSSYLQEHAADIAAEAHKPFQAIGGIVELLGEGYFPVIEQADAPPQETPAAPLAAPKPEIAAAKKPALPLKRDNSLQKINRLDVKGRIQLALKGNKEERSLLIRDGTKVVALAVLEAPKLSDGEVEKFASQKNVLEAVLRQIPLKRRFMKNYIVVRNLVANPRTPLDLGLGLMKNLLAADLKNLSGNKEISETIRKLASKMYQQKMQAANKK
jgi:hypothetical protein